MNRPTAASGTPWYLHSWPWFIVILLVVSVIASLATVVIAFRNRDIDVRHAERTKTAAVAIPGSSTHGAHATLASSTTHRMHGA